MTDVTYPPHSTKSLIPLLQKQSRHTILPRPFLPKPTQLLVDCDVLGRWHQAERSKLPARCQHGCCYLPLSQHKIINPPPPKTKPPRNPPAVSPRANAVASWFWCPWKVASSRMVAFICMAPKWLLLPTHRMPKIHQFPLPKNEAATQFPSRSHPNLAALHLIVMLSAWETRWSDQIQPPGFKMKAIPPPSPSTKIVNLPSY